VLAFRRAIEDQLLANRGDHRVAQAVEFSASTSVGEVVMMLLTSS
jgi:hypothetical protein